MPRQRQSRGKKPSGSTSEKRGSSTPPTASTEIAVILLAAGRGARMRGIVDDKILAALGGKPVFAWSLAAFVEAGLGGHLTVVYRDAAQRAALTRVLEQSPAREWSVTWVRGGAERQHSVAHALQALPTAVTHVFIHDCARPLVHPDSLRSLWAALQRDQAACLAHRVTDTIKRLPSEAPDTVRRRIRTVDRSRLWAMETPQAFARLLINEAYSTVARRGLSITDDASALELTSRKGVTLVENPHPNPKITTPADLLWAEFLITRKRSTPQK